MKEKYKHGNVDDLERKLFASSTGSSGEIGGISLIVTDGIFSMDGDIAPLESICSLISKHKNTYLLVDECHSAGIVVLTPSHSSHCSIVVMVSTSDFRLSIWN